MSSDVHNVAFVSLTSRRDEVVANSRFRVELHVDGPTEARSGPDLGN